MPFGIVYGHGKTLGRNKRNIKTTAALRGFATKYGIFGVSCCERLPAML